MQAMSQEAMMQLDGGGWWADLTCGAAVGAAVLAGAAISGASGGLAAPVAFAVAYSIAVPACGVAALT